MNQKNKTASQMNDIPEKLQQISFIGQDALKKLYDMSELIDIPADTEFLKEGQYVRSVPVVLSGLIKVFTRYNEKELLLYYIQPSESCVMSFSAGLKNAMSKVYAKTEEESTLLLLPSENLHNWITEFPLLNRLYFNQFDVRYADLLDTIKQLLFEKLDNRLLHYLTEKKRVTGRDIVSISHRDIATDLGSAREVITRTLKKLENEHKVIQHKNGIEIMDRGDHDHHF